MTTQTKILLGISLAAFAMSLTGVLWGLFLPVGAIFFGLFLISRLLAKEVALYDEEQRQRAALVEKHRGDAPTVHEPHGASGLSHAHSH
jgi:hypothetical protein